MVGHRAHLRRGRGVPGGCDVGVVAAAEEDGDEEGCGCTGAGDG